MQGIKGLKPKGSGYCIVKGSGIPRIDVMIPKSSELESADESTKIYSISQ
ncbi:MAG: hypothetical protein QNL62_03440 [Gammaproteobacteria bacterium]|nr:hypothetical protein [Gammaproteobacteria bacterium]